MTLTILMICFNIEGRGTYLRAFKLAKALSGFGHRLTVFVSSLSGKKIEEKLVDGVKVVSFPSMVHGSLQSGWDLYETYKRIQWLKTREFDIVHAFETRPNVIYPALYTRKKGAILFTDWADWFGKRGSVEERTKPIIRAVLRPIETYYEENFRKQARGTTVICSTLFQKSVALGIEEENILLLRNGFDNSDLQPLDMLTARKSVNLPTDAFIIGYVGTSFSRDVALMKQSFERILNRIPEARLLHVGRSNYAIGAKENVIHTGEVDPGSLNDYLNACNIFWLPLRDSNANRGRFPIKLSDYLSIGRPIVTTSVGDLEDLIDDNDVGLVADDNPQAITEKVMVLYHDSLMVERLSRNALKLANSYENSWQKRAKDLESFYFQKLT